MINLTFLIPELSPIFNFTMVSRAEWLAQPSNGILKNLNHPVEKVVVIHTVTSECFSRVSIILFNKLFIISFFPVLE